MEQTTVSDNKGHYKPPYRFAMGGVPLGNEFAVVTGKDAYATIEAAWSAGVRYYDMAPWYGLGLAERRYGNFLHNKNRSDFVLSSKVGKLLKASKTARTKSYFLSPLRQTMWSMTTPRPVYGAPLRTACNDWASTVSISPSCMTFPRITNIFQRHGRSNSRLRARAHFRN
jgi:hypothetical protein